MAYFESDDGCRYHFEVVGEEADSGFPMFMLHGIIQSGAEWRRAGWVDALSGLRRLILVDLPGHGASDFKTGQAIMLHTGLSRLRTRCLAYRM